MRKIILDNFIKIAPDVPQFSPKNQHYLMSGVDPLYYANQNSNEEEQVAPLSASFQMKTAFTDPNGGTITDIIGASFANGGVNPGAWTIDDKNYVYDGTNSYTPWSTSTGQTNFLTQFGNFILASSSNNNKLVYQGIGYGGFTAMTMTGLNFGTAPVYMTPFLDFCMACNLSKVWKITINTNPDITDSSPVLDIGSGWTIVAKPVVWNNYLAIPASKGGASYRDNYIFLWNGYGSTYQYNIPLPGKFIGQCNIKGSFYVVVETKNGVQALYQVVNYQLRKLKNLHGLYTTNTNKPHPVQNIGDFVTILTDSGVFKWTRDEIVGEVSYLYNTGNYNCATSAGTSNYLYATSGAIVSNDTITANTYNTISYTSQWIPVKNISGIDVEYDTPPQSGTDAINLTIYGKGEDIISGFSTTVLDSITPTTILNTTRTRLDVKGFTGDRLKIVLTTVNSIWQPILRKISIITE